MWNSFIAGARNEMLIRCNNGGLLASNVDIFIAGSGTNINADQSQQSAVCWADVDIFIVGSGKKKRRSAARCWRANVDILFVRFSGLLFE